MSLYHMVELTLVSSAVVGAVGAAYKRFMPRLGRAAAGAKSEPGCTSCSGCGGCSASSDGPASVQQPGEREQPLVFRAPQR